jgi:integrase
MSTARSSHLRVVTDEEASIIRLRVKARERFIAQYPKPESRRTMLGALDRIAKTFSEGERSGRNFEWDSLIDEDFASEVWQSVKLLYEPATARRDASALKEMLKCCRKVGLIDSEQYASAVSFTSKVEGSLLKPGRTLTESEISQLMKFHKEGINPNLQARDDALLLVLASTGARRNEVSFMDLAHVDLEANKIRLVVTKNGHPRDAWLHQSTVQALEHWISVRGDEPGPLFVALSRTCRPLPDRRLSTHQIWKVLGRRAVESGVGPLTPHDMRRYLVSTLLDQGIDLALVSRIVGHSNPATTAKYDRRPDERCRDAVARLPLPSSIWGVRNAT